ncbi:class I SAM-dependent methyltransferase [uncultured Dokdonia sp.]|uniref:class I SAM-dependent methyltransferase n=1 Tax=uncultured Dokdonia sp. TaxID=575653 RepID=UPI00261BA250|nr:class I SAM-dependent methyltransferase [uncultured Dokdonia sp.]
MYQLTKKVAKSIIPKSFLLRNELILRKLFSFKYRGSIYTCNVCDASLKKFIPIGKEDLLCPICGSRSRSRRVYHLLKENHLLSGKTLHFSPPRALYRILKKTPDIIYIATDYENEFIADYSYDITAIAAPDNSFDTIICYHVLEHILDDTKAMAELYRVLKPKGTCLVQTPFKQGAIYEDNSITSEEGRLEAFGQKDHVRIYSLEGLNTRLKDAYFKTEIIDFTTEKDHIHGWQSECVIKAMK